LLNSLWIVKAGFVDRLSKEIKPGMQVVEREAFKKMNAADESDIDDY
jgi:hypothetical protein